LQIWQLTDKNTMLNKNLIVEETKNGSMEKKIEGLERGLQALSAEGAQSTFERQSRLKTTIHLLIQENSNLKKELSFMTSQNKEMHSEVTRLK